MTGALDPRVVANLAVALLIGAMVGIEREKKKNREGDVGIAGVRTFILFAQAGAVGAWIGQLIGSPWVFIVVVACVAASVTVGYVVQAHAKPRAYGVTTEIAAMAVCLLGGLVMLGHAAVAVALGIATSAILAYKQPLHGLVDRLGADDISAGLKLLVATFIVLPLLPNHTVDPWKSINPHELWWLAVLISALSLVGYVAFRWLGPERGAAVTGVAGGLASSTAVTLTFAKRSRETAAGMDALATGILLAWGIMFLRVIVEVGVVFPALVPRVLIPFTAMAVASSVLAGWFFWQGAHETSDEPHPGVALKNPFSLTAAVKFAAFFALVLFVVRIVQTYLPGGSMYGVAALAGLSDVDAITLSMARLARNGGDPTTATVAIVVAAVANTVVKAGLVAFLGSSAIRRRAVWSTAVILAVGAAATLAV